MYSLNSSAIHRLVSHRVSFSVLVLTVFLLILIAFTYVESRDRKGISLTGLRLASWSLTQLRNEANAFDRQLVLLQTKLSNPAMLSVRYEILWSRFDYLLTSQESKAIRMFNDNAVRIEELFSDYMDLNAAVLQLTSEPLNQQTFDQLKYDWQLIKRHINELVIENMVGGETGNLTEQFDKDLNRLTHIQYVLLLLLSAGLLYFVFMIIFLIKQSRLDPLTGLPNRNYLRTKRHVTERDLYFVCEINNFQKVQTEYGAYEADTLIKKCAEKLSGCISENDTLIHSSYGEFVILKPNTNADPATIALDLIARSAFNWEVTNTSVPIRLVVGVDPYDSALKEDRPWLERHQNALRALNQSIVKGTPFFVSNAQLVAKFNFRSKILRELVLFFRNEPTDIELSIVYQPIVRTDKRRTIAGAEVLLRARLGDGTSVPPNLIVDVCEQHGLGESFGEWLFEKIGSEVSYLYSIFRFSGFLSINLNPSLINARLLELLDRTLFSEGIKPSKVCLEITEDNATMDIDSTDPILNKCRAAGVSFALDDFGTGSSSLEYLHRLPISKLKIDRYFVTDIETNPAKFQFLQGILEIARKMGHETVVEGIESQEQWDLVLASAPTTLIQGYFAHKPMQLPDFLSLVLDQLIVVETQQRENSLFLLPPPKSKQLNLNQARPIRQ